MTVLSNKYSSTSETIERVNRLISSWPADDTIPAEGFESVKGVYKKLHPGLRDIQVAAGDEVKIIEDVIERLDILMALRTANMEERRLKRPRLHSPSGSHTVVPSDALLNGRTGVSITLPARNSVGPSSATTFSRESKSRREGFVKQHPLEKGRKVAFHPPPGKATNGAGTNEHDGTWILAVVIKCLPGDKHKYEVQDAEPQEDGTEGLIYSTTFRAIIPLPDQSAAPGSPSHVSSYQEFPVGSTVLALYPDTTCFYRAEVTATPRDLQPHGRSAPSKYSPTYKLKFEDDDGQEHAVPAYFVVEWPNT